MQRKQIIEEPTWMTIGDAAKYLGVSRDTLRRWDKRWGGAKAVRSPSNHRYYTKKQLDQLMSEAKQQSPTNEVKNSKIVSKDLIVYMALVLFATLSIALIFLYFSSTLSR